MLLISLQFSMHVSAYTLIRKTPLHKNNHCLHLNIYVWFGTTIVFEFLGKRTNRLRHTYFSYMCLESMHQLPSRELKISCEGQHKSGFCKIWTCMTESILAYLFFVIWHVSEVTISYHGYRQMRVLTMSLHSPLYIITFLPPFSIDGILTLVIISVLFWMPAIQALNFKNRGRMHSYILCTTSIDSGHMWRHMHDPLA